MAEESSFAQNRVFKHTPLLFLTYLLMWAVKLFYKGNFTLVTIQYVLSAVYQHAVCDTDGRVIAVLIYSHI